ncbi:MAG: hypothetical protein KGS72_27700 [Cyanobacteria bacterium REEB67]|nr:hypothetical protein [Cyanobacteria bacterium REEB67]
MPTVKLPELLNVFMSIQPTQLTEKLQLAVLRFSAKLRLLKKQGQGATIAVRDLRDVPKEVTGTLQRVSEIDARAGLSDGNFDDVRMSHQRLQALDGMGYRACYMEKLRQVASESDCDESNREHWFGKNGAQPNDETMQTQVEQSESKTRAKRQNPRILNITNVTSSRLQAYIESLPKELE